MELSQLGNKKFVLDTSIIIDGEITKMLEAGNIEEGERHYNPFGSSRLAPVAGIYQQGAWLCWA